MKTLVKSIALLVIFSITTSCVLTGTKGNQHVVTNERTVTNSFDGIDVSQGISVYVSQGDEEKITVETDENIQDLLKTTITNNGILKVYFDEPVRNVKTKNVYVTVKNIQLLESSSGSSITAEDAIRTESIQLKSSSGSSIRVEVLTTNATSKASSGSSIKLIGKATTLDARASSGSTIRADRFEASEVEAKVSSGASIEVYATDLLTAEASSGGSIEYNGNPKNIVKNTSSGGSVHKN
jgi:hypothetical protein